MGLLMLTYPVTRFLIEHLRNDEGVFAAGMTISQLISVGLLGLGLVYWATVPASRRPLRRRPGTGVGPRARLTPARPDPRAHRFESMPP